MKPGTLVRLDITRPWYIGDDGKDYASLLLDDWVQMNLSDGDVGEVVEPLLSNLSGFERDAMSSNIVHVRFWRLGETLPMLECLLVELKA